MSYIGRFAPSPTGPLHMGSLVAALASWLDARAHHGQWLVRIEDIDHLRCKNEFTAEILKQLHVLGLIPDQPPTYQTQHFIYYQSKPSKSSFKAKKPTHVIAHGHKFSNNLKKMDSHISVTKL